jgi:lipopolysaccharide transport system ATP-binding protein
MAENYVLSKFENFNKNMELNSRSNDDPAIVVRNVSKIYPIHRSGLSLAKSQLHNIVPRPPGRVRNFVDSILGHEGDEFVALQDVSFEVQRGESVGIIGRNGSGKSTLLQIIAGTKPPTKGFAKTNGRVAALLELGSGFKGDFTGRENVFINGLILGLTHAQIEERFPQIEEFAEIGDFIDRPVKTYSSGMMVRLVFAVQVALEPDILIVDEALSVGDVFFAQKCAARIRQLKERGTTLLFVSHSMQTVRSLCERVVFLRDGKMEYFGPTEAGTAMYFSAPPTDRKKRKRKTGGEFESTKKSALDHVDFAEPVWSRSAESDAPVVIEAVALDKTRGIGNLAGRMGDLVSLKVLVKSHAEDAIPFHVAVNVKNGYDQLVVSRGTHSGGGDMYFLEGGGEVVFQIDLKLDLESGNYTFSLSLGELIEGGNWQSYDGTSELGPLAVGWSLMDGPPPFYGPYGLPVHVEIATS